MHIMRLVRAYAETPPPRFNVYLGKTWIATISFAGPSKSIVTHEGHLYPEQRTEVARLYMELGG